MTDKLKSGDQKQPPPVHRGPVNPPIRKPFANDDRVIKKSFDAYRRA